MNADRAGELAAKTLLSFDDWLELTGVDIGELGMYSVKSDCVRFHPNKEKSKPGWSKSQIKDAKLLAPDGEKYGTEQQLEQDSASQLQIPCTPEALIEFALERDVSGDLHGLLPGLFIAAVYKLKLQQPVNTRREATTGHLLAVRGLLDLVVSGDCVGRCQDEIAKEIERQHPDWRGISPRTTADLFSAANKAAKDADSVAQAKAESRDAVTEKQKRGRLPKP